MEGSLPPQSFLSIGSEGRRILSLLGIFNREPAIRSFHFLTTGCVCGLAFGIFVPSGEGVPSFPANLANTIAIPKSSFAISSPRTSFSIDPVRFPNIQENVAVRYPKKIRFRQRQTGISLGAIRSPVEHGIDRSVDRKKKPLNEIGRGFFSPVKANLLSMDNHCENRWKWSIEKCDRPQSRFHQGIEERFRNSRTDRESW
ncbi:MAG: hypothetical protein ACXWWM_02840 [Candidatus Deferrimicrobiaceae bacterium]